MKIQTLVVTLQQDCKSLAEKMNIQTEALIGSQCGMESVYQFEHNGKNIHVIATATRGVGINRNEVLLRTDADICVLADDDMTFLDGYEDTARCWFDKLPQADILIFNLQEEKPRRYRNTSVRKVGLMNYARYGAARLAFRRERVLFAGVMFHNMFGGGCEFSCGEDTLFLHECLKKGLRIMAVPATLAKIHDGDSTWFDGYSDKYFFDKGVLFFSLHKYMCKIHAVIHGFRYRKKYAEYGWKRAIKQMWKGCESLR